jgi:type I restriction enzyme S subunit
VESNWPAITADSESVGGLRQTILQLAFEGRLAGAGGHGRSGQETAPPILDGPFPIPRHWRWAKFDEVVDSRLGKMLDKAKNTGPLRPYLRNANVQWFRFDLSDVHELRLEDADLDKHSVRAGDLVICEGGEPGRLAVCDDTVSGMVFQKALHRARPRSDVDVWYLAFLLSCYAGSGYLSTFFTGATIKHLTGKALGTVPVPVPPIAEQHQIVERIEELTAACDQLAAAMSSCGPSEAALAAGLTRTA